MTTQRSKLEAINATRKNVKRGPAGTGEWIALCYGMKGERMPNGDYFTDSIDDAISTSKAMQAQADDLNTRSN